jgi:hypothetical protein
MLKLNQKKKKEHYHGIQEQHLMIDFEIGQKVKLIGNSVMKND